jgi:hypothetical protein
MEVIPQKRYTLFLHYEYVCGSDNAFADARPRCAWQAAEVQTDRNVGRISCTLIHEGQLAKQ